MVRLPSNWWTATPWCRLFEQLQLGLVPWTTYDVDEKFFDDFKK